MLTDGRRLRGVEIVPTHMPYAMSPVEQRILWHVIALTESMIATGTCETTCRRTCGPVFRSYGFWIRPPFT